MKRENVSYVWQRCSVISCKALSLVYHEPELITDAARPVVFPWTGFPYGQAIGCLHASLLPLGLAVPFDLADWGSSARQTLWKEGGTWPVKQSHQKNLEGRVDGRVGEGEGGCSVFIPCLVHQWRKRRKSRDAQREYERENSVGVFLFSFLFSF